MFRRKFFTKSLAKHSKHVDISHSLQKRNDEENEISKTALAEWKGKAKSIKQWLDTSENDYLLNREPPTNLLELENYNIDFEVRLNRCTLSGKKAV